MWTRYSKPPMPARALGNEANSRWDRGGDVAPSSKLREAVALSRAPSYRRRVSDDLEEPTRPLTPDVVSILVENHGRFSSFIERRVKSREVAEEILQEALVRGIQKADTIRDEESIVAWFYRLLRNAIVDHHRRNDVERRAMQGVAREAETTVELETELMDTVCRCVNGLLDTLKPEYAGLLRDVELEGKAVKDVAAATGITANNAAVRLHRAREALRKQVVLSCGTCATHGCLDCQCKPASAGARPA